MRLAVKYVTIVQSDTGHWQYATLLTGSRGATPHHSVSKKDFKIKTVHISVKKLCYHSSLK